METIATKTELPAAINNDELEKLHKKTIEKKRIAWGDLGVSIYEKELVLQAWAQNSLAKIKMPTKIEEVAEAEKIMKEVKADCAAITNDRKSITSKFDDVTKRLMEPEKSFITQLEALERSIISVKKADEEKKRIENRKQEAKTKCREFLVNTKNNAEALFQTKINEKISKVYEYALGVGNIGMPELPDFIKLALGRLSDSDFSIEYPLNVNTEVTADEYRDMCKELLIFDSKKYLAQYENELRGKFADYEVALKNKANALKLAKDAEVAKAQLIQSEKANADVSAKLQSMSVTPTVSYGGVRSLKSVYEIDMEENAQNMIAIVTAFAANINLCLPKLKVNKWFACTASQLGIALAKVKCDDNEFQPSGITFKVVDKL